MRYYIEAYEPLNGGQILGNLDGQAALGDLKAPKQTKRWRAIRERAENLEYGPHKNVGYYRLVNECGDIIETACNWRLKT